MGAIHHSVQLDKDLCMGCTNCVKRCPTEAIRVRDGKAKIIGERCVDCGECIRICPHHAKTAVVDPLSVLTSYRHTIALPAPSLYGQFNNLCEVDTVLGALRLMGFDEVYEVARAAELVSDCTRQLLKGGTLKKPIISSACPVVVRLIRARFPELIDNILPVLPPVELAARLAKKEFAQATGCGEEEIGAIFLSPCPAKATACRSPLGFEKSAVDAVVAIRDVYPRLLGLMKQVQEGEGLARAGRMGIGWGSSGGEASALLCENHLAADGIENITRVLESLEDEKFPGLEFIELNACAGGCVGGVLTVENPYIAKAKLKRLLKYRPVACNRIGPQPQVPLLFDAPIRYQPVLQLDDDLGAAMQKLNAIRETQGRLAGMDCGACGAPNCRAMAEDIVLGLATEDMCIYKMKEELAAINQRLAQAMAGEEERG